MGMLPYFTTFFILCLSMLSAYRHKSHTQNLPTIFSKINTASISSGQF